MATIGVVCRMPQARQVGKHGVRSELEMELARVRKELAEVKLERDLPREFAANFAKESR